MLIRNITLLIILSLLASCQIDTDENPAQTKTKLTSLEKEPVLQQLLSKLREDRKGSAALNNSSSVLDAFDWTKIQKLEQPNLDRTAFSAAAWKYDQGMVYLENLIIVKRGNNSHSYIIRYVSNDQSSIKQSLKNFKGKIEVFDLKGNKLANMVNKENKDSLSERSEITCIPDIIYEWTEVCIGGSCEISEIYWTEVEYCYGTPSNDGGGDGSGNNDNYEGHNIEPIEGGEGPGIPFYEPDPIEDAEIWELGICEMDAFKNNACVQDVWTKMKENNVAYNSLSAFLGDKPIAELCFNIKNLNNDSINGNAHLTGTYSNALVTISLNSTQLNRPKLSIARTIIHESIHAELYAKVVQAGGTSNFENYVSNNPGKSEFELLWYFIKENIDSDANWQHEYMADYYIGAISSALKELKDDLLSPSFQNYVDGSVFYVPGDTPGAPPVAINWDWDDFYEALAWEGLTKTVEWGECSSAFKNKNLSYMQQFKDLEISAYECN